MINVQRVCPEVYYRDKLWCRGGIAPNQVIARSGRKEMFYLKTHSTHFIYGYMVKDHSDSERGNPLPPHELLFLINSKGSFICTDRIAHTTAFVKPVVEHWLEREMGPPHEGSIQRPVTPWVNALTTELHLAPLLGQSSRCTVKFLRSECDEGCDWCIYVTVVTCADTLTSTLCIQ